MKISTGEKVVKEGKDMVRVRIETGTIDEIVRLADGRRELILAVEIQKR